MVVDEPDVEVHHCDRAALQLGVQAVGRRRVEQSARKPCWTCVQSTGIPLWREPRIVSS